MGVIYHILEETIGRRKPGASHIPRPVSFVPDAGNDEPFDGAAAVARWRTTKFPWESAPELYGHPRVQDAVTVPAGTYQVTFEAVFVPLPLLTGTLGKYQGIAMVTSEPAFHPDMDPMWTPVWSPYGVTNVLHPQRARERAYIMTLPWERSISLHTEIVIPTVPVLAFLAMYAEHGPTSTHLVNTRADWRQLFASHAEFGDGHWTVWP